MKRGWLLVLLLVGCGKEVGRVALVGEGSGDASVTLSANQAVALWTSLDASWTGAWHAGYTVELRDSSGKPVSTTTCDPFNVNTKTSSVITNLNDHHAWSYNGKMSCAFTAPTAGTYTVHATMAYGAPKPPDLVVKDISLVIKI